MKNTENIIGLCDGHDSGACVLHGTDILFAANEERFTRRKLEVRFPDSSLEAGMKFTGVTREEIRLVAVPTAHPSKTLARVFPNIEERYYLTRRRKECPTRAGALMKKAKYTFSLIGPNAATAVVSRAVVAANLKRLGISGARVEIIDHHHAHAASAAFCSGFESCAVITLDGIGDGLSGTVWKFSGGALERVAAVPGRDSFGIFFEHVTNILNMRELEDEGKVMALANHTFPIEDSENPILDLIGINGLDVHFRLGPQKLYRCLADISWRYPAEQFAFMAQRALEVNVVKFVSNAAGETGMKRVALAGGVFSNIKLNMLLRRLDCIQDCFVFPHMGDGGLALGAAMVLNHRVNGVSRYSFNDIYLGPSYVNEALDAVKRSGLEWRAEQAPEKIAARHIADGKIIMWFQGRMEAGPRALGNRSILALPGSLETARRLNVLLKKRSWFQPFCPSMLEAEAGFFLSDYDGKPNRFMTMGYMTKPEHRDIIKGVIAADGSCRPQIVGSENPRFKMLLEELARLTGHGVVLNTSFNIHGEPIVCTPDDALRAFAGSGADVLIIENIVVESKT